MIHLFLPKEIAHKEDVILVTLNHLLGDFKPKKDVDVLIQWDSDLDVEAQTSGDDRQIQVDINIWKCDEGVVLALAHELVHVAQLIRGCEVSKEEQEKEAYGLECQVKAQLYGYF